MEKKQLDLNAPFISARRFSSPSRNSGEIVKRKLIEKPPANRQQSLPVNRSDWESEEVTKPAAVPFQWEQIPGRPKGDVESVARTPEEPSGTPRLPPGRLSDVIRRSSGPSRLNSGDQRLNDQNMYRRQGDTFAFNDHAILLKKLNESLNCKDESDSESGEDAYSDALDTLSGSWSLNYSVSGISGYQSSDVKPSGTFAIDAQTRDFMMNRFLPAAKAAVLETPKHVLKKPLVVNEQPKPVRKVVSRELGKPLLKQYTSDALPYYSKYIDNVESEDDDDDDDDQEYRAPVKKSGKAWWILPRFCVKNSLCLLNPIPGMMKPKGRPPTPSSAGQVRRLGRNAHSGPLDKNGCHVPQKKFYSGLLPRDLIEMESKLANDSNQFPSYHRESSPLRRYRSGSVSPYRNESPRSPFREGAGFLGVPKQVENYNASKIASSRKMFKALQDVSGAQINERGSGPLGGDAVEKTLYVDSVSTKAGSRKMVGIYTLKSDKDNKDAKKQSPGFGQTVKAMSSTKLGRVHDVIDDVKVSQSVDQESNPVECTELVVKSPLPPPLPKSPSESWLWRTLPTGNPFSHSRRRSGLLESKKQGQSGPTTETIKWETIVKTSNLRPDHVLYSQELIPHASYRGNKS